MCLTVWFLRRFGWFGIEYGFRGRYERILCFNSKRVICEFEMNFFLWRSNLTSNDDVIFGYVGLNTGSDFTGPFFLRHGNFSGLKKKLKSKNCCIAARFVVHKPV